MQRLLQEQFTNVQVVGIPSQGITGEFEVINAKSGKKYHSKLAGGDTIDDNQAKLAALVKAIEADGGMRSSAPPAIAARKFCAVM